jgi:hypothetical protein
MLITYRRTGGLFALLTLAGVAVAVTVLTVAVAAIVLAVGVAITSVVVLGCAVVPRSWRGRPVLPKTPWPRETIDTTAVIAISSSDTHNVPRMDDSTR